MAQAIVFLPLLGFLIAGFAALLAHKPARGADVLAFGNADHSGGHDHAHADHHNDDHAHDDHHAPEVSPHSEALSRFAEVVTTSLLVLACILSWSVFFQLALGSAPPTRLILADWISVGTFVVDWAIRVDTLTAVMLVVVTSVSCLVHLYSIGYMHEDPARPRFFAYLSLFTFAMLMLVTSDNLVQMFFGWEGVGLASYLLIGFWFKKKSANDAAMKAFIVNRVGDFGFALGIFLCFWLTGAVSFDALFAALPGKAGESVSFLGFAHVPALELAACLLFMGAMGKSAQFLLHTWLPDAMEGPTPVSALIHAATMVTAGVFMVARLSPVFEAAPFAQSLVLVIGATTAFFAATVGLVQNDIKRVIAYSTCSQLGYMFVALGTGAYSAGVYHLFTHAFFKALLFLGAGSVIHAMHHEQDIRKMGGLAKHIPFTTAMMAVGTLALTGFPFTAGFYSKDAIIEAAYVAHQPGHVYAFVCVVLAAGMTSFYSWRLFFLTFMGKSRADAKTLAHAHESPLVMLIPLGLLAIGAIAAGFPLVQWFIGHHYDFFWKGSLFTGPNNHVLHDIHDYTKLAKWVPYAPLVMMMSGFILAWLLYLRYPHIPAQIAERHGAIYRFLLNKWYFDELYDLIFVRPSKRLGHFLWKKGDGAVIDGYGPDGVAASVTRITARVVRVQTGFVYHYAFAMLLGVAGFVTWYLFAGGGALMAGFGILTGLMLLPLLGAAFVLLQANDEAGSRNARWGAFWTTIATFALSLLALKDFESAKAGFQLVERKAWLGESIVYQLGVDGVSMPFVILTTFLMPFCILASFHAIKERVKEYFALFLLLETVMIGVFVSLDLVLFYVFFEAGLIPMFLIIGIWGGARRIYASFKFFLYTLLGSVLMLLAIMAMYFAAGTTDIVKLLAFQFPPAMQTWLWLAFFASFAVKMPMWPVHTWLPDAHVEAPTAGSVILAGILLKMGGYGFLRFSIPMFPLASVQFADLVFALSVIAIIYTSLVAMMQEDIKKLIAYSSVAHMGFVTMGLFTLNAQGVQGAVFQMVSHGLVSGALFLCVGVVYDRMHTRMITAYGGLVNRMPLYALVFLLFTMANVGLPGTSGFVGEFLTLLGSYKANTWVAFFATTGVILSAAYALWLFARVVYGKTEKHALEAIPDLDGRELALLVPLAVLVIYFGVQPNAILSMSAASVDGILASVQSGLASKAAALGMVK